MLVQRSAAYLVGSGFTRALRNVDHPDRADVRFARRNIQIHDAHVVDLYRWVCAQYLVGVRRRNKGKAQLNSALDRISERITLAFPTLARPEAIQGPPSKNVNLPHISM